MDKNEILGILACSFVSGVDLTKFAEALEECGICLPGMGKERAQIYFERHLLPILRKDIRESLEFIELV